MSIGRPELVQTDIKIGPFMTSTHERRDVPIGR
jgi:hypothetical protein